MQHNIPQQNNSSEVEIGSESYLDSMLNLDEELQQDTSIRKSPVPKINFGKLN